MSRQQKHPVYDFLFEYFSFRPAHLLRWTPGYNCILEGAISEDVLWSEFTSSDNGLSLDPQQFPAQRTGYLRWASQYLENTRDREPTFGCSGLHEWAMVYRDLNIRHPYVPFRLSRDETDAVIESQALQCSHYDAYRFFTTAALPRNRWELTRAETKEHDQPGCLHVNMDLYRFAYKIAPFCSSNLLADAFDLAKEAREIDMRASPYDLAGFGFHPIKIETVAGRLEYSELQRSISNRSQPIRDQLLVVYRDLLKSVDAELRNV